MTRLRHQKRPSKRIVFVLLIFMGIGLIISYPKIQESRKSNKERKQLKVISTTLNQGQRLSSFWLSKGQEHLYANQLDSAILSFRQVTSAVPNSLEAHTGLAEAYVGKCRNENLDCKEALQEMNTVIGLNPNEPVYFKLRSELHDKLGYREEARQDSLKYEIMNRLSNE